MEDEHILLKDCWVLNHWDDVNDSIIIEAIKYVKFVSENRHWLNSDAYKLKLNLPVAAYSNSIKLDELKRLIVKDELSLAQWELQNIIAKVNA